VCCRVLQCVVVCCGALQYTVAVVQRAVTVNQRVRQRVSQHLSKSTNCA